MKESVIDGFTQVTFRIIFKTEGFILFQFKLKSEWAWLEKHTARFDEMIKPGVMKGIITVFRIV